MVNRTAVGGNQIPMLRHTLQKRNCISNCYLLVPQQYGVNPVQFYEGLRSAAVNI